MQQQTMELLNKLINSKHTLHQHKHTFDISYCDRWIGYISYKNDHAELTTLETNVTISYNDPDYQNKVNKLLKAIHEHVESTCKKKQ